MMNKYIEKFPEQLIEAINIGRQFKFEKKNEIKHIVICGMGGSGIGGDLLLEIVSPYCKVPIIVNKSYHLPSFANEATLVILSSYSGNTEETLSACADAMEQNCQIVAITTGGKLANIAQNAFPVITIPNGMPPRTCIGYSVVSQLFVLYKAGIITDRFIDEISNSASFLVDCKKEIQQIAETMAASIFNKIVLIYTSVSNFSLALRLKQQLNENAKMQSFAQSVPEMNHNELVGFFAPNSHIAVICLRTTADNERIALRFDLVKSIIETKVGVYEEIFALGANPIERSFYLLHLIDWLSYYCAMHKMVDPIAIDSLIWLKDQLDNTK